MGGKQATSRRFATLDGLRGVAAICVMIFHAGSLAPIPMHGGYLAVDLFFGLSGFVLAHAYDERLRTGLGAREFFYRRLIRVYPMYLIGALLGALLINGTAATLLMIPAIGTSNMLYPGNVPMWSLAMELIVNVAFGLLAARLSLRSLICIVGLSGLALAAATLRHNGIDMGAQWSEAHIGLLRTVFSFTLGCGLYRLHLLDGSPRRTTWLAALLPLALAAALFLAPADRGWWDSACIFAIFPALVWLGTRWELPRSRLAIALGDLSFPLYCIHYPFIRVSSLSGAGMALLMTILVAGAWALDRALDRPLRRKLGLITERAFARPDRPDQTRIGIST